MQEDKTMATISKFIHFFTAASARDNAFENYYGSIARSRYQGGPSASEARRDFEVIRRTVDRAVIY